MRVNRMRVARICKRTIPSSTEPTRPKVEMSDGMNGLNQACRAGGPRELNKEWIVSGGVSCCGRGRIVNGPAEHPKMTSAASSDISTLATS
jgi:hypothetical protein